MKKPLDAREEADGRFEAELRAAPDPATRPAASASTRVADAAASLRPHFAREREGDLYPPSPGGRLGMVGVGAPSSREPTMPQFKAAEDINRIARRLRLVPDHVSVLRVAFRPRPGNTWKGVDAVLALEVSAETAAAARARAAGREAPASTVPGAGLDSDALLEVVLDGPGRALGLDGLKRLVHRVRNMSGDRPADDRAQLLELVTAGAEVLVAACVAYEEARVRHHVKLEQPLQHRSRQGLVTGPHRMPVVHVAATRDVGAPGDEAKRRQLAGGRGSGPTAQTRSWLTVQETAATLGVDRRTVQDRIAAGRFHTTRRARQGSTAPRLVADHCVIAAKEGRDCPCSDDEEGRGVAA